jgi:hypothetical protein
MTASIRLATGPGDFAEAIGAALESGDRPAAVAERRGVAVANSWQVRGVQVRGLLAGLGAR